MPATVIKVGLNPKQQTQTQRTIDLSTGIITETVTEYWIVQFASAETDPTVCYTAFDGTNRIPLIGRDYGSGQLCHRIQPMLDGASAGQVYRVQVDYSSRPQPKPGSKWDVTVNIDGAGVTESLNHDGAGKAIVNSAGQPFSQQPTRTYFDNIYRIGFKSTTLDVASIDALQGSLNSAAFSLNIPSLGFSKTFEAQSTELTRCPTSTTLTGDTGTPLFWQVEYELYYRRPIISPIDQSPVSGWTIFLLDQGYCTLSGGQLRPITNPPFPAQGLPLNSPSYLDGSGGASATAHWLQFAPAQPTGDFTPLFAGLS